jgi:hypothetical protein
MFDDWFWLVVSTSGVFSVVILGGMLLLLWPAKILDREPNPISEETARAIQVYADMAAAHRQAVEDPRPQDGSHL